MITCPWCSTNYASFQSNCDNCGGSLPRPAEISADAHLAKTTLPSPPLAPRQVPNKVLGRFLLTDGGAIAAGVLALLGFIFTTVGVGLIIPIITLPIGVSFAGLGVLLLAAGIPIFIWRYRRAMESIEILKTGVATLGKITSLYQNYQVRVNYRHPWVYVYEFQVHGQNYHGKVSTLNNPDPNQQSGSPVYVLYKQDQPEKNTLYVKPY